ncbi:MAG: hypothetical protein RLZZ86_19 [Cyanobacteriota bacterium]|jgi:hypothetical protein
MIKKDIQASILSKSFDPNTVLESRKMKFIISTGAKDRGKEVINMENWSFENYKMNPIVGYQHAVHGSYFTDPNPDMVIGKSEVSVDSFNGKKVIVAEAEFEPAEINPIADKILKKLVFGSLNAASVGILPTGNGKTEKGTYYYDGQELLEWSVVNIPMNQEAIKLSIDRANDAIRAVSMMLPDVPFNQLKAMKVQEILDLIEGKDLAVDVEKIEKDLNQPDPNAQLYLNRLNQIKNKNG